MANNTTSLEVTVQEKQVFTLYLKPIEEIELSANYSNIDVTIYDGSVYTTEGIKRDYICKTTAYKFDEEETKAGKLIDAVQKRITKTWRFYNDSKVNFTKGFLVPVDPDYDPKDSLEIATDASTEIQFSDSSGVKPGKEFFASCQLKIPGTPGIYKRKFCIKNSSGDIIEIKNKADKSSFKSFTVLIRVVPDTVYSPVKEKISYVADPAVGRAAGNHTEPDVLYFSNWGPQFFNREGVKTVADPDKKIPNTHQYYDRFAFDVNGADDFDKEKKVYAIADGEVAFIHKTYGAIWIYHDFKKDYKFGNEKNKNTITGFYAVYMHIKDESWTTDSGSKKYWKIKEKGDANKGVPEKTIKIKKGDYLGKIWNTGPEPLPYHLHFAIYPLPKNLKKSPFSGYFNSFGLDSVHVNIVEQSGKIESSKLKDIEITKGWWGTDKDPEKQITEKHTVGSTVIISVDFENIPDYTAATIKIIEDDMFNNDEKFTIESRIINGKIRHKTSITNDWLTGIEGENEYFFEVSVKFEGKTYKKTMAKNKNEYLKVIKKKK